MTATIDPAEVVRALELIGLGDDGLVHGCGCGNPHPPARSALDVDPGRWRRIRVGILKRDGYRCRVVTGVDEQGTPTPCGAPATVAGHVLARRLGGCDRPGNLRAECKPHSDADGARLAADERSALELARLIVERRRVTHGDESVSSRGSSTDDPAMKVLSLSQDHDANAQVRGSSSPTPVVNTRSSTVTERERHHLEPVPVTVRETPGPADEVWDAAPWLDDLRNVPPEGVWPRFMTLPHPRAVGSYLGELLEVHELLHHAPARWWQRLAYARIGEHDEAGMLVWAEYLGTISRQGGKSWALRTLAMWRVLRCGAGRWGDQTVLHTGKDVAILREVLKPAQSWAEVNGLTVSRNNLEPGLATGAHMTGSRWIIRAKDAVYGYPSGNPLVDEAWAVPASIIDEGVEPTTVEQTSPQLGMWSTAHRRATGLVLERRAAMLGELFAPVRTLLLEWSAPTHLDRGDRAGWRAASPHWSEQREQLIAKAYRKVLRGEQIDPEEPDPTAAFDAQWLNRWPDPVPIEQRMPDEPLLDPRGTEYAREAWQACHDPDVQPDPAAPLYLAVEVDGHGAAAAAASLTRDGRVVMGGWRFANRTEAVDWCQDVGEEAADPLLLIGASMLDDPELAGLEVPVEPSGGTETRAALPLLRELVAAGRIAHDGGSDTTEAVLGARVRPGVAGAAMLFTGTESTALVRALLWAMRRAHLDRA